MSLRWNALGMCLLGLAIGTSSLKTTEAAEKVKWNKNFRAAAIESTKTRKPMIVEITAEWCKYCHKMMETTFQDEKVVRQINSCYIPVSVNADHHPKIVKAIGVKGLPTTVLISPDLEVIEKITGFKSADQMAQRLGKHCKVPANAASRRPAFESMTAAAPVNRAPAFGSHEKPVADMHLFETPGFDAPAVETVKHTEEPNPFAAFPPGNPNDFAAPTAPTPVPEAPALPESRPVEPAQVAVIHTPVESSFPKKDEKASPEPVSVQASVETPREAPVAEVKPTYPEGVFGGHCLVSMLDQGKLTAGQEDLMSEFNSEIVKHATADHQSRFDKDPAKYWPAGNGYCAVSVVEDNELRMGDPQYVLVYRNRLWFFSSEDRLNRFFSNPDAYIRKADEKK